jgi:hypothetical protein
MENPVNIKGHANRRNLIEIPLEIVQIFPKFVTNTRETKQLSAPSLLNLTGQSLIPFRHVMKNGLPLNQLLELGWTFSFSQKL